MKLFSLLLCVGMLCITTASRELPPQPHHLHKRQADITDPCTVGTITSMCTSGEYQGEVNISLACNHRATAEFRQKTCQSSSSGLLCGAVEGYIRLIEPITTTCGSSPTTCSSECQELLTTTRAELGCCANVLNDTNFGLVASVFNNSLWSLCNVEPVTEECEPGPIKLLDIDIEPDCDARARMRDEVTCRTQYLESLREATIESCGFDPGVSNSDRCAVNEEGVYCDALLNDDFSLRIDASDSCTDTSTCDPLCINILNTITSCCFITEYNKTDRNDWLSYEFWTLCSLNSPGFCELKFNDELVNIGNVGVGGNSGGGGNGGGAGTSGEGGTTGVGGNVDGGGNDGGGGTSGGDGTSGGGGNVDGSGNSGGGGNGGDVDDGATILKAPGIVIIIAIASMVLA